MWRNLQTFFDVGRFRHIFVAFSEYMNFNANWMIEQMNYQTSITDYLTGRWILRIYGCCMLKMTEVWMDISLKRHWLANSKIIYKWHLHTSKIFASWLLTRYSKNLSPICWQVFFGQRNKTIGNHDFKIV